MLVNASWPLAYTPMVDAIVTDPPYGLRFMGKQWDYDVPSQEEWKACLDCLPPGGHMLVFGGSRTYHRMAVAVEDAGFEIRDCLLWLYGSGFPKGQAVDKLIDKHLGATREVVGTVDSGKNAGMQKLGPSGIKGGVYNVTVPATPEAALWEGWNTTLKPAHEPIILARKPLKANVAETVLAHGTGALNIPGCAVPSETSTRQITRGGSTHRHVYSSYAGDTQTGIVTGRGDTRHPSNVIIDEYVTEMLGKNARFFYCPKASAKERNLGCENGHPTVKPIELMRYLCRLITPPGGSVLDPYMGSGSTGIAAELEGFHFLGIERDMDYYRLAQLRLQYWKEHYV